MVAFALSGKTRFLASLRNDEEKNEMTAGGGETMLFALPGTLTNPAIIATFPRWRLDLPPLCATTGIQSGKNIYL